MDRCVDGPAARAGRKLRDFAVEAARKSFAGRGMMNGLISVLGGKRVVCGVVPDQRLLNQSSLISFLRRLLFFELFLFNLGLGVGRRSNRQKDPEACSTAAAGAS